MKRVLLLITLSLILALSACIVVTGTVAVAEGEEISVLNIWKKDELGNTVPYVISEAKYSRDIVLDYSFNEATHFYVNVFKKVNAEYVFLRTSETKEVVDGKGSYSVVDSGYLRVDCVAKNGVNDIYTLNSYVLSDLEAPTTPVIDKEGTMDVVHADPFNVTYEISDDVLSGIDYQKSWYKYVDVNGDDVIPQTAIPEGPSVKGVTGINTNGTLIIRLYDNAGNFGEWEKAYSLYNQTDILKPQITVSPNKDEFSKSFYVTIAWPQGTSQKYYRLQVNGNEQVRQPYTTPIEIDTEGEVTVLAFYNVGGVEHYVTETVNMVDATAPTSSSIHESIKTTIDLMGESTLMLSVKPFDARSGIKRVYLKNYLSEFTLTDVKTYTLDATERIGTSVTIVAEDYAGNSVEYAYSLTGFDREKIVKYSELYSSLNKDAYDATAWIEVTRAFEQLAFLMSSQDSLSSEILVYSQTLEKLVEGKHAVKVTVNEVIDGLTNDFKAEFILGSTNVKKGGTINVGVSKVRLNETELQEKYKIASTIAAFPAYEGYAFNLNLKDVNGVTVTVYDYYKVSLSIPAVNKLAKVYCEDNGTIKQLSAEIKDGVITFRTKATGNFYFIVEDEVVDRGEGLTIGGKFFPLNVLLIAGGAVLGVIVLTAIVTPLVIHLIKKKKRSGNAFNYFK